MNTALWIALIGAIAYIIGSSVTTLVGAKQAEQLGKYAFLAGLLGYLLK